MFYWSDCNYADIVNKENKDLANAAYYLSGNNTYLNIKRCKALTISSKWKMIVPRIDGKDIQIVNKVQSGCFYWPET